MPDHMSADCLGSSWELEPIFEIYIFLLLSLSFPLPHKEHLTPSFCGGCSSLVKAEFLARERTEDKQAENTVSARDPHSKTNIEKLEHVQREDC